MVELLAARLQQEECSEAVPPPRPDILEELLQIGPPVEGRPPEEVLALLGQLVEQTPSTADRRFFNQLFAGREISAAIGESVAGFLNSSMYTFKAAGVQTMVEKGLVRRMADALGYGASDGIMVPGGSMANLVAMVMARNAAFPEAREEGVAAGARLYVSDQSHYSIRKNAGMLGIGRANVRAVASDEQGRLLVASLDQAIREDLESGLHPFLVVGTAGTTVMGAFDPLIEIADVCRERGMWFHVDAAFGGSFALHPQLSQGRLDGIELSDSCAWDAHKMMGVPMPCATILVREDGAFGDDLLNRNFSEAADYLYQQDEADLNPGTKSIQCGRRNDALKLWTAWQALGDAGWRARLERQLELAAVARRRIDREPSLQMAHEPQSINLCFDVEGVSPKALCEQLSRRGLASVGYGMVNGRRTVRLVTANPHLDECDIERFFDDLLLVAEQLRGSAADRANSANPKFTPSTTSAR